MQETKKKDLRQVEDVIKEPRGGILEKKEIPIFYKQKKPEIDSGSALQLFLDHIPICSIPGIKNSPELQVLELNAGDSVRDAVHLLYKKNVSGAPIADLLDPDTTIGRFSDRCFNLKDIFLLDSNFQQCEKALVQATGNANDDSEMGENVFFTMLKQNPQVGQTKIGELAKSFLWDSFFPVRLDDTLFHVLLLLSKHPLQVVPVIENPDSKVIGFVTQNAVIQLLLRSDGLDWFDGIADKPLSEFRFENEDLFVQVYGDQSIAEALWILGHNRVGAMAVVNRGTKRLIGTIRRSDIYLLLENDNLLHKRKTLTVVEFIHMETSKPDTDPTIEREIGALLSAGALRMKNSFLPRMDQPVTNKKTDTVKAAMKNLAKTKSSFSFLVDDLLQPTGLLTVRDMIIQFTPPCVDSSIHGCGFFESALEQTGCKMKNRTMIRDH